MRSLFLCLLIISSTVLSFQDGDHDTLLLNGWYPWEPYQYVEKGEDGIYKLSGLDAELIKAWSAEARQKVQYEPVDWITHQENLKDGTRHFAGGATISDALAPYVYYSKPYRYESNALFTLKKSKRILHFSTIKELIKKIKESDFRLGVVEGFTYVDKDLDAFIKNPDNKRYIIFSKSDEENLKRLLEEKIDGFVADRLSGATNIWRTKNTSKIAEQDLGIRVPIHLAFSRKSTTPETVKIFDDALQEIKDNGTYDDLFAKYLHPLILLQTLDSQWFFILEIIGTIAFAISGLILAYRDRATLFGALIYAMLPSTGGGILRDVIVGRDPISLMLSPIYMYIVLVTVLIGFFLIKLIASKSGISHQKRLNMLGPIFVISDAIGLSCFTVLGVMVAFLAKLSPLWMWGAFLAFLTGAGGGILRDLVSKSKSVFSLHGEIYPEIAIVWGAVLSIYLVVDAHMVNPDRIFYAVLTTCLGAFLSRMAIYHFKIPNIRFHD